jgi:phosphoserine phosphatase
MNKIPLIVDLDGTLIKSDLLFEGVITLIKEKTIYLLFLPFWFLRGKAVLKSEIAKRVSPSFSLIPKNQEFLDFLIKEKENNRYIILATASTKKFAEEFSCTLGIFDEVISSSSINMKNTEKLRAIKENHYEFDYAGNSNDDIVLLEEARHAHVVNASSGLIKRFEGGKSVSIWGENREFDLSLWVNQLRIYQWVKNLLIFIPLFVSQTYFDFDQFILGVAGFLCFSVLASSTYVLNDLLDLESDRKHIKKKHRPFASGLLSIKHGLIVFIILLFTSLILSYQLSQNFFYITALYLVSTIAYSVTLKSYVGIDIIMLAILFT